MARERLGVARERDIPEGGSKAAEIKIDIS
jgi:hypothetical protein